MPDNPEREIEKQLRASAEQRGTEAGAPFELHEATRRMLQAEVVREYGKPQSRPDAARSWWFALGPRLAVAAPLVVLLIAGVVWFSAPPPQREKQPLLASVAEKASFKESETARPPARADTSAPVPAIAEDKNASPTVTLAMGPIPDFKKDQPVELDAARSKSPATSPMTTTVAPESLSPATGDRQPLEVAAADNRIRAQEQPDQTAARFRGAGGFGGGGGGGGGRGGLGGRTATIGPSLADSTRETRRDAADSPTSGARAVPQTPTRQFASVPTETSAPTRGADAVGTTGQREVASTWYFRNSVQSFNGGGLARGGRGGGGRGAARAPAPPSASVLNSFRFEQAGNETRIVDEDGSIYLGQIQSSGDDLVKLEEASRPQSQLEARNRAAQETKLEPAMPQKIPVYFSVTGLNRTLSQQIVFTGQLQQAVSFPVNNGQTNATRAAAGQLLQAEAARSISTQNQVGSVSNVLLQQRIVGRARLSDSRELPVDAFQIQR